MSSIVHWRARRMGDIIPVHRAQSSRNVWAALSDPQFFKSGIIAGSLYSFATRHVLLRYAASEPARHRIRVTTALRPGRAIASGSLHKTMSAVS